MASVTPAIGPHFPAVIVGASITGGSIIFPGGFVGAASVTPNCPNCGSSLTFQNKPFVPNWLCPADKRSWANVEVTPKAKRMWRRWQRDFGNGTDIDRYALKRALHAEMRIVEKKR